MLDKASNLVLAAPDIHKQRKQEKTKQIVAKSVCWAIFVRQR